MQDKNYYRKLSGAALTHEVYQFIAKLNLTEDDNSYLHFLFKKMEEEGKSIAEKDFRVKLKRIMP